MPADFRFPQRTVGFWRPLQLSSDDFFGRDNNYLNVVAPTRRRRLGARGELPKPRLSRLGSRRSIRTRTRPSGASVITLRSELSSRSRLLLITLSSPLCAFCWWRARIWRACSSFAPSSGSGSSPCARRWGPVGRGWCASCSRRAWCSRPLAAPSDSWWRRPRCLSRRVSFPHRCRSPRRRFSTAASSASPGHDSRDGGGVRCAAGAAHLSAGPRGDVARGAGSRRRTEGALAGCLGGHAGRGLRGPLVVCGLLLRALWRVESVDPGFDTAQVLGLETALPMSRYGETTRRAELYDGIVDEVRALPGVTHAAYISFLAVEHARRHLAGRSPGAGRRRAHTASLRYATPGLFDTLGIALETAGHRAGRHRGDRDGGRGQPFVRRPVLAGARSAGTGVRLRPSVSAPSSAWSGTSVSAPRAGERAAGLSALSPGARRRADLLRS